MLTHRCKEAFRTTFKNRRMLLLNTYGCVHNPNDLTPTMIVQLLGFNSKKNWILKHYASVNKNLSKRHETIEARRTSGQ